jgi:hypothetical protein
MAWIKLPLSELNSEIFGDADLWKVWCFCLLSAAHATETVKVENTEIVILPGQLLVNRKKIHKACYQGEAGTKCPRTLWRKLKKLEELNKIKINSNRRHSMVSICDWGQYHPQIQDNTVNSLVNKFTKPLVRELVVDAIEKIALIRKTKKVAEKIKINFVETLLSFEEWKVGTGIMIYLEKESWLYGKGERYLVGIIRKVTEEDRKLMLGKLKHNHDNRFSELLSRLSMYSTANNSKKIEDILSMLAGNNTFSTNNDGGNSIHARQ